MQYTSSYSLSETGSWQGFLPACEKGSTLLGVQAMVHDCILLEGLCLSTLVCEDWAYKRFRATCRKESGIVSWWWVSS